jgi:hypothetical protein
MSYVHIIASKENEFTPEFLACINDDQEIEAMLWHLHDKMITKYGDQQKFFYSVSESFSTYHSPTDSEIAAFKELWNTNKNGESSMTEGDAYVSETTNEVVFSIADVLKTMFHDLIHFRFLNIKWRHER